MHNLLLEVYINHCMDIALGESLEKKVSHQMTHAEIEEINKQVQELLRKGLIKEIYSPCVVPMVLEVKKNGEWKMCILEPSTRSWCWKYKRTN